jgi:hypothetical protein
LPQSELRSVENSVQIEIDISLYMIKGIKRKMSGYFRSSASFRFVFNITRKNGIAIYNGI